MNESSPTAELQRLLADWANGSLCPADAQRLGEAVESDPSARLAYLAYATVEAELHALGAVSPQAAVVTPDPPRVMASGAMDRWSLAAPMAELAAKSLAGRRSRRGAAVRWFAIAASMAAVAAASSWLTRMASEGTLARLQQNSGDLAGRGAPIARVTATQNCRWDAGSTNLGFGSELVAGQRIGLAEGLAEFTFDDGARLLVEGPASLRLLSDPDKPAPSGAAPSVANPARRAVLLHGRLAAIVPMGVPAPACTERVALTLASHTAGPNASSQFGLAADGDGGDEVHVFRGDVEVRLVSGPASAGPAASPAEAADGRPLLLRSAEAARVSPRSSTLAKFYADRDLFVRSISATGGPLDGLYAYEGFDYADGPLSGQNGGFGWAGPWADIEAACPPGEVATNVVEPGSLAYPGVRVVGAHATQRAQQNRIRRALGTSLGGVFDAAGLVENQDSVRLVGANGRVVYLGFVQSVDRVGDGFYGLELHRGDGNGNRVLCIGAGAEGSGYGVTSNYNGYGKANYAPLGVETTRANFFVVKIEYGAQNHDLVTVFRNPRSLVEEPVVDPSSAGGVRGAESCAQLRGNFAFDRISLGDFDGVKRHEVDELRIGTAYRAVTGRRDRGAVSLGPPVAAASGVLSAPLADGGAGLPAGSAGTVVWSADPRAQSGRIALLQPTLPR